MGQRSRPSRRSPLLRVSQGGCHGLSRGWASPEARLQSELTGYLSNLQLQVQGQEPSLSLASRSSFIKAPLIRPGPPRASPFDSAHCGDFCPSCRPLPFAMLCWGEASPGPPHQERGPHEGGPRGTVGQRRFCSHSPQGRCFLSPAELWVKLTPLTRVSVSLKPPRNCEVLAPHGVLTPVPRLPLPRVQ